MFNYRIKFKGLKFPSPDPTIPAKDYILNLQVWGARLLGNDTLIAEGLLPLQPIFQVSFLFPRALLSNTNAIDAPGTDHA